MSELKGIEIHDVLGLSAPLAKLVETVSQAIGKIYEPFHIRRMAKAKATEIQIISEALNNSINLPTEYSNGNITISTQDSEELAKRTGNRLFYQEMRKQQNIEMIVGLAADELKKEETVSAEPVDQDWTIRFFNSVEDISNEDMQKLWGKVLAGEVKHPKSFSIRTLEKLKNISQTEAIVFQKVANYCFYYRNEILLSSDNEFLKKHGLLLIDILILEDCGLIQSYSDLVFVLSFNNDSKFIHNQSIIGRISPKNEMNIDIKLPMHKITSSGSELYNIIEKLPNDQYFLDFIKQLRNKERQLNISAHKIISFSGDSIEYSDIDELPPDEHKGGFVPL